MPTDMRSHILGVAGDLFFREGLRAVGVDTIVAQSGVAKMTLYRYFPTKDALIAAYLERSNDLFWQWFDAAAAEADGPRAQIRAVFAALAKLVSTPSCYGCPFLNTAAEFPARDYPGHRIALAHKETLRERLREMAARAGASDPDALGDGLFLLMDGAFAQARMYGPENPARHVAQAAEALIQAYTTRA
jgi:AcrR family transcriptional regulator